VELSIASPPVDLPAGGDDGEAPLRLENVVRRFGGITAVDDVSLAVGSSERLAVIGPNGAGKTTLFRVIAGEMPPTSGRVYLFGQDVTRVPAHKRARVGLSRTFQVSNLFRTLTVEDNVRLAAQAGGRSRWRFWSPARPTDEPARRAKAVLAQAGIAQRATAQVAALSHGEQRQLEIAMALATGPRLLLLDEPAAGLAAAERAQLQRLLESLPGTLSVVLIEHDMNLALGIADRVLCLHNGRTVALGTPDDVRRNPDVQAVYLGRDTADEAPDA
jgi:branched-chain amino acid transport system ATP-binding protein